MYFVGSGRKKNPLPQTNHYEPIGATQHRRPASQHCSADSGNRNVAARVGIREARVPPEIGPAHLLLAPDGDGGGHGNCLSANANREHRDVLDLSGAAVQCGDTPVAMPAWVPPKMHRSVDPDFADVPDVQGPDPDRRVVVHVDAPVVSDALRRVRGVSEVKTFSNEMEGSCFSYIHIKNGSRRVGMR